MVVCSCLAGSNGCGSRYSARRRTRTQRKSNDTHIAFGKILFVIDFTQRNATHCYELDNSYFIIFFSSILRIRH